MRAEIIELLSWVAREPRSYPDAIEVWKTTCPQHSVWEDALGDQLIEIVRNGSHASVVVTPHGLEALRAPERAR
jgi:hypothetical protein